MTTVAAPAPAMNDASSLDPANFVRGSGSAESRRGVEDGVVPDR
ncbi:MAG: hypothetical protein ACLQMH_01965 [Solirubrobacteraceae bacterium]